MTDIQEASALGHMNDIIDIYSNSWGPPDRGILTRATGTPDTRQGLFVATPYTPDTLLKRTFEDGVRQVKCLLCT